MFNRRSSSRHAVDRDSSEREPSNPLRASPVCEGLQCPVRCTTFPLPPSLCFPAGPVELAYPSPFAFDLSTCSTCFRRTGWHRKGQLLGMGWARAHGVRLLDDLMLVALLPRLPALRTCVKYRREHGARGAQALESMRIVT